MKTAASILKSKPHQQTYSVTPEVSVFDAVKLMSEKNIGALLVVAGAQIAGLVTERDYARKIALMSRTSKETPVSEIMTTDVLSCGPDQTSDECMALMTENRVRHLPVMDGDRLLGVISIGDLVKDIISEQRSSSNSSSTTSPAIAAELRRAPGRRPVWPKPGAAGASRGRLTLNSADALAAPPPSVTTPPPALPRGPPNCAPCCTTTPTATTC